MERSYNFTDPHLDNTRKCYQLNKRKQIWYLVFSGCAVAYLFRININIAIVNMIKVRNSTKSIEGVCECYNHSIRNDNQTITLIEHGFSLERYFMDKFNIKYNPEGFDWSEYEQGLILGAFFWLHFASAMIGGILARKYGTKTVYGISNLVGILLCFVIPAAAYMSNIYLLLFIRLIQGLFSGAGYPSIHNLTAHWIPPNERSNFLTSYLGNSAGMAFFYPLFGFVMALTSWEWVFHLSGIIGLIWFAGWQYFIYDTPAKHPRIDIDEKLFIEESLSNTIQKEKQSIPWHSILTSKQIWLIVMVQIGNVWGMVTMTAQSPTYFRFIHGFSIRMTGILSGIPHALRIGFSFPFSYMADYMLKHKTMSRTNVRKCATFGTTILNGCCFLALAFSGCNSIIAITFIILGTICQSAHSAGAFAIMVDISPNYSSVVFGISLLTLVTGFISPYIVGVLTDNNQTTTQWMYIFMISGIILISSGVPYMIFGDASVQSWNDPKQMENKNLDVELENLNKKNENENS